MITSTTNKQVKYVSSLIKKPKARREEELFVAEGLRICQEIPEERIHTLYVSESFLKQKEGCRPQWSGRGPVVEVVADEVFKALSDTQTPQGVLALVRQYHYTLEQAAGTKDGKPALLMILEQRWGSGKSGNDYQGWRGSRSDRGDYGRFNSRYLQPQGDPIYYGLCAAGSLCIYRRSVRDTSVAEKAGCSSVCNSFEGKRIPMNRKITARVQ